MNNGRAFDLHTEHVNSENCDEQVEYLSNDGHIVQLLQKFSNLRVCQFAAEANK
jgi:hypothetical protein